MSTVQHPICHTASKNFQICLNNLTGVFNINNYLNNTLRLYFYLRNSSSLTKLKTFRETLNKIIS